MNQSKIVAITGPIGAGKTTFLGLVAPLIRCDVVPERIDDNPFFERFCSNPRRWTFHSQLAFMLGSAHDAIQSRRSGRRVAAERPTHEQLAIFCVQQREAGYLTDDEYSQLARVATLVEAAGAVPDLLIALTAPHDVLRSRVAQRGRLGEEQYDESYVASLHAAYERWTAEWTASPTLHVDTSEIDVRQPEALKRIASEINSSLESPT